MSDNPLVSVIIPTYNRAHVLHRSIMSVIHQSYINWELIVVDDGSTDGTSKVVNSFCLKDQRVNFFLRDENTEKGANSCRNLGLVHSKGEYVAFLDSDDEWAIDRLKRAVTYLTKCHAKAIYSGAIIRDGLSKKIRHSRPLRPMETAFDFVLCSSSFAQTSTMIVQSKFLGSIRFDEYLQRHQDFDFFIRVNEVVNWTYFENYDVTVFWDRKPGGSHIDFNSCMVFYQTHLEKSNNRSVRINYLSYILESCAKLNPSNLALQFFKNELLKEGVKLTMRQKVILRFPYIFHNLYVFKKKMF